MTRIDYVTCVVTVTEGGITGERLKVGFFRFGFEAFDFPQMGI